MPVAAVREIVESVRSGGDAALRRFTREFDRVEIGEVRVTAGTITAALRSIDPELRGALEAAAARIEAYQRHRARATGLGEEDRFEKDGIAVVTRRIPVRRAGLYVPGGRARYPSTVLMAAIPARVAGVAEVAVCIPPGPEGDPPRESLAAAAIAGVDEVYRVGGAQAIAAMAYGTETIAAVDVIAGPGNVYVSLAQREVAGVVGVPNAFAGPSEVVVVGDASAPAAYMAIDLAVQAEHGPDGLAWLVTWSPEVAEEVDRALESVVESSPRRSDLESTLRRNGYVALVDGPQAAVATIDAIAPEHLEVMVDDPDPIVHGVRNAGVVFVGASAPASVGDYVAGPSHVLPTNGTARFAGALSLTDFTREASEICVTADSFEDIASPVALIARAEGLEAHARSVELRRERP